MTVSEENVSNPLMLVRIKESFMLGALTYSDTVEDLVDFCGMDIADAKELVSQWETN